MTTNLKKGPQLAYVKTDIYREASLRKKENKKRLNYTVI